MPRKKMSIEEQIRKILTQYENDVFKATRAAIDRGAVACKQQVQKDSPVHSRNIVRFKGNKSALVESLSGEKRPKGTREVKIPPGTYKKGWRVKKDKELIGSMKYGKRIGNTKMPHLTHLLENGHRLVDSNGNEYGHVDPIPHIENNAELYAEKVQKEITDFLKKKGEVKI